LKGTSPSNEGKVGEATEIVARKAGLSKATFERAVVVLTKAPEELKDKVRAGEVSIHEAYQQVKALDELASADLV
jgi:hypothetical protein